MGGLLVFACIWAIPHGVIFQAAALFSGDGDPSTLTPQFVRMLRAMASWVWAGGVGLWVLGAAGPPGLRRLLRQRLRLWKPSRWVLRARTWKKWVRALTHSKASDKAAFLAVAFSALFCRIAAYWRSPVYNDEAYTLSRYVMRPFPGSITEYGLPNNHPLNTFLVNVAWSIGGPELAVVRLPALAAGCCIPVLTYVFVRRRCGMAAALLATAFTAGLAPLVEYSARVRGYSLVTLCILAAFLGAQEVLRSQGRRGMLCTGAACALAHFAIPSAVYATTGVFLYLLAGMLRQRRWTMAAAVAEAGVLAGGLTLLLYGPMLLLGGLGPIVSNRWVVPFEWAEYPGALAAAVCNLVATWFMCTPPAAGVLLAAGAWAAFFIFLFHPFRRPTPILPFLLASTLAVSVLTRTVGYSRTFNYLLPWVCAASGCALATMGQSAAARVGLSARRWLTVCALALALLSVAQFAFWPCETPRDGHLDQPRAAVAYLTRHTPLGEPIAVVSPIEPTITYYGLIEGLALARIAPLEIGDTALLVWDENIHYPAHAIRIYDIMRVEGFEKRIRRIESVAQFGKTHISRVWLAPQN